MSTEDTTQGAIQTVAELRARLSAIQQNVADQEDLVVARERLKRWKLTAVERLERQISYDEGQKLQGKQTGSNRGQPMANFSREVGVYDAFLKALSEEIRENPAILLTAQSLSIVSSDRLKTQASTGQPVVQKTSKSEPCVFIGHGRSPLWARLQLFLQNDLGLKTVIYESESRAGDSIIPILEGMLYQATFAVLILTAEDETGAAGSKRARQNVIHEAGLFQGRLGFKKAILLRQDGLEDFSNVAGLQYVGFTGDRIDQTFYELQRVLKREGLIQ